MAPARVVRVVGGDCEVELGARVERASLLLEPDVRVDDWVLVLDGTVVRRLDPEQAAEMLAVIGLLGEPDPLVQAS
jgi:hydrogenase maturation factor